MSSEMVTLDVRDEIAQGHEPFGKIMDTVARLRPDEKLRLVAPFEPLPLFSVRAKRGYSYASQQLESGDWEVLFTHDGSPKGEAKNDIKTTADAGDVEGKPSSFIDMDARGLEALQPMVKILEALAALPVGAGLRARTDRRPMHLYAHLQERGFISETAEQTDGSFLTNIRRR